MVGVCRLLFAVCCLVFGGWCLLLCMWCFGALAIGVFWCLVFGDRSSVWCSVLLCIALRSLFVGPWSLVVGLWSVGRWSLVCCSLVFDVWWLLVAVCCMLMVVVSFAGCCSLCVACCALRVWCLVFGVWCLVRWCVGDRRVLFWLLVLGGWCFGGLVSGAWWLVLV